MNLDIWTSLGYTQAASEHHMLRSVLPAYDGEIIFLVIVKERYVPRKLSLTVIK